MSLNQIPLFANAAIFVAAAALVWAAGSALAGFADTIADRKKLGKAIMGLVFLAAATELPEIATTFTAAIAGSAPLVLGNMFGGIVLQTAVLAITDAVAVRGVLTNYPRKPTHALEAAFLILLLSLLVGVCIAGELSIGFNVGLGTVALAIIYVFFIRLLRRYDAEGDWVPVELPEPAADDGGRVQSDRYPTISTKGLVLRSAVAAFFIFAGGIVLVHSAQAIAVQSGLGSSFVGLAFLAAATSLPELSTTIAAARLGAYTMAISNIFGSNLIMLMLLFPADILYRQGPILQETGRPELLSLAAGILVTAIYVAGLLMRRKPQVLRMGVDSICVLAVYVGSLGLFYFIR